ncbi:MAG: hypothetical protein ACE5KZ_00370 [Candidatus Scalinduaceae bacterium]
MNILKSVTLMFVIIITLSIKSVWAEISPKEMEQDIKQSLGKIVNYSNAFTDLINSGELEMYDEIYTRGLSGIARECVHTLEHLHDLLTIYDNTVCETDKLMASRFLQRYAQIWLTLADSFLKRVNQKITKINHAAIIPIANQLKSDISDIEAKLRSLAKEIRKRLMDYTSRKIEEQRSKP